MDARSQRILESIVSHLDQGTSIEHNHCRRWKLLLIPPIGEPVHVQCEWPFPIPQKEDWINYLGQLYRVTGSPVCYDFGKCEVRVEVF